MPVGGEAAHHVQITLGLFLEDRYGGFRPDQQVDRFGAEAHVTVQGQLGVDVFGVPLQFLLDIALQGGHCQRLAGRLGPGVVLQGQAHGPGRQQQDDGHGQEGFARPQTRQVAQQGGTQGQAEGDQPHATDRSQAGQRTVELAVAGIKPGETGEEPAAKGFLADPQGGEAQGVGQGRLVAAQPARPDPGRQGEEPGDGSKECQQQTCGQ
ncbi:hypothetical protein D3C76_1078960 [compost metagenome]